MSYGTIEDWQERVACNVRVKHSGDIQKIASLCHEAAQRGENPAVWHHSALFYGNSASCNCHHCATARAAKTEGAQ